MLHSVPILTHEGIRQTAGERSYSLPKATQALLGPGLQSTARPEIPGNEAIRREGPTATLDYMTEVAKDQGFERAAMLGMLTNAAGEPLGGYEQAQWMLLVNEGLRREAYTPPEGGKNVAFGLGETLTVEEGRELGIIAGKPVPDKVIYSSFQKSFGRAAGHVEEWFPGMAQEDPTLFALLVDSTYRGSLGVATNTRKFIQEGEWEKAAREYLKGTGPGGMNKDYAASLEFERSWAARGEPKDSGIHVRMERLSDYLDAKAGQEKRAREEEFRKNIPPELGGNLPAPVVEPPPPDVQWDSASGKVEVGPAALAGAAAFSFPEAPPGEDGEAAFGIQERAIVAGGVVGMASITPVATSLDRLSDNTPLKDVINSLGGTKADLEVTGLAPLLREHPAANVGDAKLNFTVPELVVDEFDSVMGGRGALRRAPGVGIFAGLTGAAWGMGYDPEEEMPIPLITGNAIDRLAQKAIGAGIGLLPSTQTKKRKGETDRAHAARTIPGNPGD